MFIFSLVHRAIYFAASYFILLPSVRVVLESGDVVCSEALAVAWSLRVGGHTVPKVEEFNYLGFTSEGKKMECGTDRRIGVASTVMPLLHRSAVVKT